MRAPAWPRAQKPTALMHARMFHSLADTRAHAQSFAQTKYLLSRELNVDGTFGFHTTVALQKLLDNAGFTPGPIDGRFGGKTKQALQAYLTANGYEVGASDGWCGWPKQSVKALQTWTKDQGAEPGPLDGWWGRRTTRALQMALNINRDKWLLAADAKDDEKIAGMGVPSKEEQWWSARVGSGGSAADETKSDANEAPWWQKIFGGSGAETNKAPNGAAGAA